MDTSQSSENTPPIKRLKQATLNFFKPSPSQPNSSGSKSKKRKSTDPVVSDSPNKTAKLGKPLFVIAEPPNSPSKQNRTSKPQADLSINDHEVSSSSEAELPVNKTNNGKCCLMDRFVCKLPKSDNQEISSTNESVDVNAEDFGDKSGKLQQDVILVDDDSNQAVAAGDGSLKVEISDRDRGQSDVSEANTQPIQQPNISHPASNENVDILQKSAVSHSDKAEPVEKNTHIQRLQETFESLKEDEEGKNNDEESQKKDSASNLDVSAMDSSFISDSGAVSTPQLDDSKKEDLEVSVNESSFLSETSFASTPCKETNEVTTAAEEDKTKLDKKESKTPASGKKGKKVDLVKKAEKEAQKQKLKEEKELLRSEKKRKLEEEKAEKERIKREKKEAKDKERQEQREKLQKEKEEKEKLKEEERKKKEEERLAKEDEKKKKQAVLEAKLEEKKKREEEKKQKEEEKLKEEEEKRKKAEKVKEAFQSFFIKPKENPSKPVVSKPACGIFSPFEIKKDMHLAPAVRRDPLSEQLKNAVDQVLGSHEDCHTTYLKNLSAGKIKPQRSGRVLRVNPKPPEDIELVHDPKALKTVQHKVKLLQFHTDYRPPYYGTWRKNPKLSPRQPWKKDESFFDYEVDSDDEWEEEEPGESLSCSDGEEEKGEKAEDDENEDEEDGWMVPHGYLSEDEGCNEDDEITPEKLKLQQLAKAKAWEAEQKKKLQAAPLVAVGCFFEHSPSALMSGDVRLLYEFRGVVLSPAVPIPTGLFGCPEQELEEKVTPDKTASNPSQRGVGGIKKSVPEEAMTDLIRLVHGNVCGIKRLIRDFRIFWFKRETANSSEQPSTSQETLNKSELEKEKDTSILNDSTQENAGTEGVSEECKEENGTGCSISKRQLEIKINAIAVRDKRPGFHKTCWYVKEEVLKEFDLVGLVSNSLIPPEPVAAVEEPSPAVSAKDQRSIMDFALSKEELAKMESLPKANENSQSKMPAKDPKSDANLGSSKEELVKKGLPQQPKTPQRDQRSIMDFTLSKDELAKKEAQKPLKPVSQSTPKDMKKTAGQLSIMEFAKKGHPTETDVKKNVEVHQPTAMEVDDPDVVILEEVPGKPVGLSTPQIPGPALANEMVKQPKQNINSPESNIATDTGDPKQLTSSCYVKLSKLDKSE